MIVQVVIILFVFFIALRSKIENSILLVVFLLPFHYLLKCISGLFLGSSSIISLWKELIIFVLFARVLTEGWSVKKTTVHSLPVLLLFVFFLLEIVLFLFAPVKEDALVSVKVYLFPFIIAFVCANMKIGQRFFKRLVKVTVISVVLVCIVGYLQQYVLNVPFAFLMNMADGFDANGDLLFLNTASMILGLQRMYGSFTGPNELGLYLAILISFLFYFHLRIENNKKLKLMTALAGIFAVITLVQTFSRVSWGFAGLFFVIANFKKVINENVIIIGSILLVCLVIFATSDFGRVFVESITFQEASAQARPDEFFSGLSMIIDNPLGLGLGTVQYAAANPRWSTEIFWWLVLTENGAPMGILLFSFYLYFAFKSFKDQTIFSKFTAIALIMTVLIGFASVIVFEPIFLTFLWMFVGMGFNEAIVKGLNTSLAGSGALNNKLGIELR